MITGRKFGEWVFPHAKRFPRNALFFLVNISPLFCKRLLCQCKGTVNVLVHVARLMYNFYDQFLT